MQNSGIFIISQTAIPEISEQHEHTESDTLQYSRINCNNWSLIKRIPKYVKCKILRDFHYHRPRNNNRDFIDDFLSIDRISNHSHLQNFHGIDWTTCASSMDLGCVEMMMNYILSFFEFLGTFSWYDLDQIIGAIIWCFVLISIFLQAMLNMAIWTLAAIIVLIQNIYELVPLS